MLNRYLLAVLALSIFIVNQAQALTIRYEAFDYLNKNEIQKLKSLGEEIVLKVCCYYPTQSDLENLKQLSAKRIIIEAGHLPYKNEINILDKIGTKIEIHVAEIFPGNEDIVNLNASQIDQIKIISRDWPMLGEVTAFNQITRPLRFDILKKEWPTEEHMVVIRQFKEEIEVGFHTRMLPGPGYANFFNSLRSAKVFVQDEHPWPMDPDYMALYDKTRIEVATYEFMYKRDLDIINRFENIIDVELFNAWPLNNEMMSNIKGFGGRKLLIHDDGYGNLLKKGILLKLKTANPNIELVTKRTE